MGISNNSIVFTYAITIALKSFNKPFIDELTQKLNERFANSPDPSSSNTIINLQYTSQNILYYIPYVSLYLLLFLYIYISVSKIEFVKSKWGLAFAAVAQVIASLFMSIGTCSFFGLTPTLNSGEIFIYLIIFIGFENIIVLTQSVVSTPVDLEVRYRIALGLKKESWLITKIITFELIIIFSGILTMVPAIQEFCVFAYVGILIDFFMQMIFFVTVLSIDIRRMELSDLNRQRSVAKSISDPSLTSIIQPKSKNFCKKCERTIKINPGPKSVQFFYFWGRTRFVQRVLIFLSTVWIILIFYKSIIVVELMRHDVNMSKETMEALFPKGVGFSNPFRENPPRIIPTETQHRIESLSPFTSTKSTMDYLRNNFNYFFKKKEPKATSLAEKTNEAYHWLTLFESYNISLYNRYVAILPQIELHTIVDHSEILKYRNLNEIHKYDSVFFVENDDILKNKTGRDQGHTEGYLFKSALYELISIVILGIPTIVFIVYLSVVLYKCLCNRDYERWKKSWSTANIKREYQRIHLKASRECGCKASSEEETGVSSDSDYGSSKLNQRNSDEETETSFYREAELVPIRTLNAIRSPNRHSSPVEFLVTGSGTKLATSDFTNIVKIWSLKENKEDLEQEIDLNREDSSVWSICMSRDDRYLYTGENFILFLKNMFQFLQQFYLKSSKIIFALIFLNFALPLILAYMFVLFICMYSVNKRSICMKNNYLFFQNT